MLGLSQSVFQLGVVVDRKFWRPRHMLDITDNLGLRLVFSVHFMVARHKVVHLKNIVTLGKTRNENGSVAVILLFHGIIPFGVHLKTAAFLFIQQLGKYRSGVKLRQTAPVYGAFFGNQCRASAISYNSVIQVVHSSKILKRVRMNWFCARISRFLKKEKIKIRQKSPIHGQNYHNLKSTTRSITN